MKMSKKPLKNGNNLKQHNKKPVPQKDKPNSKNTFNSTKNNKAFNIEEISNKLDDDKLLYKMLKSYNDFVNKNFPNITSEYGKNHNYKSEKNCSKGKPTNYTDIADIIIKIKDPNTIFENFLNKINPDFLEENIICQLPDIPELYFGKNKLGKKENNKEDYIKRTILLKQDNEIIISKDVEINEPLKEEIAIELTDDKNINYIQKSLNVDKISPEAFTVLNDQEEWIRRQFAINKIIEIWEPKMKKKIYIGLDPINKKDIIRIYGKKFDKEGKMKIIQYNSYIKIIEDIFTFELTVKELFNLDSMSKEEILPKIKEVIKKFKAKTNEGIM